MVHLHKDSVKPKLDAKYSTALNRNDPDLRKQAVDMATALVCSHVQFEWLHG